MNEASWLPWMMFAVAVTGPALTIITMQRGQRQRLEDKLGALQSVLQAEIDKVSEVERRARHDLQNHNQTLIGTLQRDMRELERNTVRREDMQGLEQRVNGRLDKIDAKLDRALERAAGAA